MKTFKFINAKEWTVKTVKASNKKDATRIYKELYGTYKEDDLQVTEVGAKPKCKYHQESLSQFEGRLMDHRTIKYK